MYAAFLRSHHAFLCRQGCVQVAPTEVEGESKGVSIHVTRNKQDGKRSTWWRTAMLARTIPSQLIPPRALGRYPRTSPTTRSVPMYIQSDYGLKPTLRFVECFAPSMPISDDVTGPIRRAVAPPPTAAHERVRPSDSYQEAHNTHHQLRIMIAPYQSRLSPTPTANPPFVVRAPSVSRRNHHGPD